MGKCKYCGLDAGFLFRSHRQCRKVHKQGVAECLEAIQAYFRGDKTMGDLVADLASLRAGKFLADADIEKCARQGIRQYAETIGDTPVEERHVRLVDEFIGNVGCPLPSAGDEMVALGTLLYRGVLSRHFTAKEPMEEVERLMGIVMRSLPVPEDKREELALTVLDKAAHDFLSDGLISDKENEELEAFTQALGIYTDNLPERFKDSDIVKIKQSTIIRQLQKGLEPQSMTVSLPIILGAKEYVVWVFSGVTMYQQKTVREWVGGSAGVSVRIAKGVYYRTGGTKGHPVEHTTWEKLAVGSLVMTNKNFIFFSPERSAKTPYKKIIGAIPYNDGIELQKDGVNAKSQIFQGFDSWFTVNFLSFINP